MNRRMRNYRRFLLGCLLASFLGLFALMEQMARDAVPDEIHIRTDQETDWEELFSGPLIRYDPAVETSQNGSYRIGCRLLGIFPLKTVKVTPMEEQEVYASGFPVGIYMETKGVLVIDSGEIRDVDGISRTPAEHIVQPGDYIRRVDGQELISKRQLVQMVEENQGKTMEMEVMRRKEMIRLALTPIQTEDGTYKLGIWVRDNVQGIGTLTYVKEDGTFAALGHGISDVDTGERLNISSGELYDASILSVQKGASGNPGELRGMINYDSSRRLGVICRNTSNGIIGKLQPEKERLLTLEKYPTALKQELAEGEAQILCDVGDGVRTYEIEITQIDWNAKDSNKSFVIHVTDPDLIAQTGGIVQGMSGSPILQNGKLVGAVTHVFVNDPEKGYGIFIETMLEEEEK